eukprot:7389437-Prymnesium_polylepis.2
MMQYRSTASARHKWTALHHVCTFPTNHVSAGRAHRAKTLVAPRAVPSVYGISCALSSSRCSTMRADPAGVTSRVL